MLMDVWDKTKCQGHFGMDQMYYVCFEQDQMSCSSSNQKKTPQTSQILKSKLIIFNMTVWTFEAPVTMRDRNLKYQL